MPKVCPKGVGLRRADSKVREGMMRLWWPSGDHPVEGSCELLVGGGYLSCPCSEWGYDELYLDLPGLPAAEDEKKKDEETDGREDSETLSTDGLCIPL